MAVTTPIETTTIETAHIDASAHPFFASQAEFVSYLPPTMRTRGFPGLARAWYQAPGGEFLEDTYGEGFPWTGGFPASSPQAVREALVTRGAEAVVLHPLSRGNLPDWLLGSGAAGAANRWLAERWLDPSVGPFYGTIQVNPQDIDGAIAELRRWADHPRMVQVGVPLQSRELYGKPQFQPLWRAAAEAGLPVAMHTTLGAGIESAPTPAGHTRTYAHYAAYMPLNYFHHLSSLILDGTFARIPDLKVVFADGGLDILTPLIWRLDTFWRAMREQTPWVEAVPSSYLRDHVRFVYSTLEGFGDESYAADWLEMTGKADLLLFGSNHPFLSVASPSDLGAGILQVQREKILRDNALALYPKLAGPAVSTR